ncbi:helix-turn-helix domain-containing protein [Lactobacillus reuteri]|uniref:Helix-turn-helix domain-containing protein n=1 Tax=Limosilactobacillus reuteri TaxID=1598 RepID=A0A347TB08_LIMRT|nr:helix-turn-helix transcriptional regulator [Limosilactobacillus reuteri]AXX75107.1 helix-turn-helix domain-containing protein [Limosilactobacillus reuteri]MCC4342837.1 helix-turn-helix domain-containing protein [Limosilactobacillus reuteri]MCC4344759.1 helix-turn-helix domain-containing protein [Limosilactobacillus reuteri]MRH80878.1 helix-turn-helix domain-containing protein [Limosilactobacillus reuteri]WJK31543.1 helix-turn-helix transcriptional regulator [Limosilactobacillus reuteri]
MNTNNIGEKIANLRKKRGMSQSQLAKELNIGTSTLGMYETGKRSPNPEMLNKLADYFHVSVDYLLGREIKTEAYYELSNKEKNDIALQAEKLMEGIESGENLNFYGEPATEEQKERLLIAVQTAMEMNKRKAKKKFTPKKYRD